MMILLDPHTGQAVAPSAISSMRFSESCGNRYLEIMMKNGSLLHVQHQDGDGDSVNIYQLHKQLLEAA